MKRVWAMRSGPPEVLSLRDEPDPAPRTGEVRIRVEAIGVNFTDVLGRMGKTSDGLQAPFVPGLEVSGEIDMVAPGVRGFKEGEAVFAFTHGGAYADLVCVPHTQVFTRFPWMDAIDGAALAIDYLTAFVCLLVMGSLRSEDTVLIHGANNSTGVAAIHLARVVGARTMGTSPALHHELLMEQGLDHAIDPFVTDYQEEVRALTNGVGVQLIVNPYMDLHWRMNYQLLAPAGRLVNYVGASALGQQPPAWLQRLLAMLGAPAYTPARLQRESRAVAGVNLGLFWEQGARVASWMDRILDWYDQALFRPFVNRTFALEQAADAHVHLESERAAGKILLKP
ncbi:MAG TPA: zinc-binding dehydrogenase [Candidatus Binatia bacterium]|nr:zinc-binding dehydrogenase [Candidatus Binatia bacterium]